MTLHSYLQKETERVCNAFAQKNIQATKVNLLASSLENEALVI